MVSYGQYCPVARAAEILGDRWTLLIVREMVGGVSGFNELGRCLPGISRSVLAQRMRALERAGVVERRTSGGGRTLGYRLTAAGRDLRGVLEATGNWGATWALGDPLPGELDPSLLVLWMARHVELERLPRGRTVVEFKFRAPKRRLWLVLEREEVSVCMQHPGFDVDLIVGADSAALYDVYFGRTTPAEAVRSGAVTLEGPSRLTRAFGGWFSWSAYARAVREAPARRQAAEHMTVHDLRVSIVG